MKRYQLDSNGFGALQVLIVLITSCVLISVGVYVWHHSRSQNPSPIASMSPTPQANSRSSQAYWLVEDWAIPQLQNSGLSAAELQYLFNGPNTLLIHPSGTLTLPSIDKQLSKASLVESFASYQKMQAAINSNAIIPGAKYVLYDNENWAATPIDEQNDPIGYEKLAENVAHQHGLKLIFTPAADLVGSTGSQKYVSYLQSDLVTEGAKYADVFEIQAQQAEGMNYFNSFATSAIQQAKTVNPDVVVLVGIGTNPAGRTVSAQTIYDDYMGIHTQANGYWFNVPGKNSQPSTAVQFFNMLYAAKS